jgi:hypothetical protein
MSSLDKMGKIGAFLHKAGETEMAEFIVKLMLEEDDDYSPLPEKFLKKSSKGKKIKNDKVESDEETYDYSEDEGDAVSEEELEVKVDEDGFASLA